MLGNILVRLIYVLCNRRMMMDVINVTQKRMVGNKATFQIVLSAFYFNVLFTVFTFSSYNNYELQIS